MEKKQGDVLKMSDEIKHSVSYGKNYFKRQKDLENIVKKGVWR